MTKPFLIAEISSNHNADLDRATDLIKMLQMSGLML